MNTSYRVASIITIKLIALMKPIHKVESITSLTLFYFLLNIICNASKRIFAKVSSSIKT